MEGIDDCDLGDNADQLYVPIWIQAFHLPPADQVTSDCSWFSGQQTGCGHRGFREVGVRSMRPALISVSGNGSQSHPLGAGPPCSGSRKAIPNAPKSVGEVAAYR
jgi:hypothetical protein